jgi:hypothetical protein
VYLLILWLNVHLGLGMVGELWGQNRMFVWFPMYWANLNLNICVVWGRWSVVLSKASWTIYGSFGHWISIFLGV